MNLSARDVFGLILFIAVCLSMGAIGGLWTASSVGSWYASLAKPALTPPGWIFGPVWTTLYVMMGVAAWMYLKKAGWPAAYPGMALFAVHLLVNLSWSGVFFAEKNPGGALAVIGVLWVMIASLILVFWKVSPVAGALLVPYLAWVSFASYLNYGIWRLNG